MNEVYVRWDDHTIEFHDNYDLPLRFHSWECHDYEYMKHQLFHIKKFFEKRRMREGIPSHNMRCPVPRRMMWADSLDRDRFEIIDIKTFDIDMAKLADILTDEYINYQNKNIDRPNLVVIGNDAAETFGDGELPEFTMALDMFKMKVAITPTATGITTLNLPGIEYFDRK